MTIQQVFTRLGALKPHSYTSAELIEFLRRIEKRIYNEIILTHHDDEDIVYTDYTVDTATTTTLLVPEPYDELYLYYLMMHIDLNNFEFDKYNNTAALFNAAYQDFEGAYHRAHLPKRYIGSFFFGQANKRINPLDQDIT